MDKRPKRTSERVEIEIPIEVAGTDCLGAEFFDRTSTVVISRQGGNLRLERKLVPQQEVRITCLASGLNAEAVVVGQLAQSENFYYYGIKFLNDETNIWGVEFPPMAESDGAAGRFFWSALAARTVR